MEQYPWLSEYKVFGIPQSCEPYPDEPVYDILEKAAKKFKNNGIIQLNYKMNYPQVKDHVDRLATALAKLGLEKGDRVATILPTSIQFVIADYAISRAGLVHIPSSSLEPLLTLEHKFNMGGPKAVICDSTVEVAREAAKNTGVEHVILTKLEDYSNNPPVHEKAPGAMWMSDLIADNDPNPPAIEFDVTQDLETLLFTGGTTGLPKGCMLTHRNIYSNSIQGSTALGRAAKLLEGAITVLLGLPLFHSYGHIVMHTMTYQGANQILIPDARDTDNMVEMIKQYNPVIQVGVPTQFMKISGDALKGRGILGMSGSAPLPPSTQKSFEEKSGGGIMEGYGLSEMGPVTHLNTSFLLRIMGGRTPVRINNALLGVPGVIPVLNWFLRLLGPVVVGRIAGKGLAFIVKSTANKNAEGKGNEKRGTAGIPASDTQIKLLDVNTEEPLTVEDMKAGKRGELCLKGPQRMLGYWPDPGTGLDDEGYVRTSDVVEVDENGYFYIVDRTKDMIIVSGYKVYSREVDDLLYSHPDIAMAATIGIPDPKIEGSERVAVYVQPKPGSDGSLTEESVIQFLRERVAKYAVPKVVKIVDEMPLTEVQKMNKKVLREWAIDDFAE